MWPRAGEIDQLTETGGGQCNLDFYKRTVELPHTVLVILMGEGSFHQFHGGVTSNQTREQVVDKFFNQLNDIWHGAYRALTREPIFYGSLSRQAQPNIKSASEWGLKRLNRFNDAQDNPWFDHPVDSVDDLPFKQT